MDPQRLRRVLSALALAALATTAAAAPRLRVLVQRAPLAGFSHYAAAELWPRLRVGDALTLLREPSNPHDSRAIAVWWEDQKIGYLPRAENDAVSTAMDQGGRVEARIAGKREDPDPRRRLDIEVFVIP